MPEQTTATNDVKKKSPVLTILVLLIMYLTSFLGTLFMLFPYLPIVFINKRLFHILSDASLKMWFGLSVFLIEKVCQIKIRIHRAKKNRGAKFTESSIVLMNHRTRLDWLFYFCVLYRLRAMSYIKIILKDTLKKVPGPSWAMQTALFIFIKRKWDIDRSIFSRFISYYSSLKKRVYILIFPEGTDLTPETIERSNKFAETNNLMKYEHVLHPRTTGFVHIFNEMIHNNNMIDSVMDVTVAYRGGSIPESELDFASGRLPTEIHFYVENFSTESIRQAKLSGQGESVETATKNSLEYWITERWRMKELFLRSFYANDADLSVYDQQYDLMNTSHEFTLYVYPIYWLAFLIAVAYSLYTYTFVLFFAYGAFSFYMGVQLFCKGGLDNLLMDLADKTEKRQIETIKNE